MWMTARRAIVVLLVASIVLACGGRPLPGPGEPVTLVFKHAKHPQSEVLADLIAEFEAEHPGIYVREEILPASSDDQHQFYVINLAAGADDFDIIDMDIVWVPEFARAGWLTRLSPTITEAEVSALFAPAVSADRLDGTLYGVPWFVDVGVLYYRQDLLQRYGFEPPETFEELVTQARVILDGERDPALTGFVWQGLQYEGLVCTALEFIRGNGGRVLASATTSALTETETLEALRWVGALIRTHEVTPPTVTTITEEPARQLFQSGRAIFMRNWPYAWPLVSEPPSPVAGRVGVITVPHFEGHSSVPTLGGYHLGINARSPHPDEAAAFIRFMIREAQQRAVLLRMGRLPAHRGVYDDAEILTAAPHLRGLVSALEQAQPRPVTPYYLMISQVLQPELSAVVAGLRSPEEAMELAAGQIDRLLAGS